MAITKATASAVAPAAKGDLVVGSATNDAAVLNVGSANQVLTVDSSTTTGLKWATPSSGLTFTNRLKISGSFNKIADNGSGTWVAVGGSGNLYTSTDGQTWTSRTSGFGAQTIRDITFGNGIWVAVGGNGLISTSTDAITWTARTSNMGTNTMYQVVYANSLFVAVGAGGGTTNTGGITYSTDGITWTRKSQSITVGTDYYSVTWNGTNWIVVATVSTNNYLYASTPSGTWTAGNTWGGATMTGVLYDGTRTLAFRDDGVVGYSTSTTFASVTAYGSYVTNQGSATIKSNILYNGYLYYASFGSLQRLTPISSTTPLNDYIQENPSTYYQSGGTIAWETLCIWVGSNGYLLGSGTGAIYSSF